MSRPPVIIFIRCARVSEVSDVHLRATRDKWLRLPIHADPSSQEKLNSTVYNGSKGVELHYANSARKACEKISSPSLSSLEELFAPMMMLRLFLHMQASSFTFTVLRLQAVSWFTPVDRQI